MGADKTRGSRHTQEGAGSGGALVSDGGMRKWRRGRSPPESSRGSHGRKGKRCEEAQTQRFKRALAL